MPARDIFHNAVRQALEKEGWKITHDPLPVSFELGDMYRDLGAEKFLQQKEKEKRLLLKLWRFWVKFNTDLTPSPFPTREGE